jgi:hypothetical protein
MNLVARMKVTGINQLWVADVTYIRLAAEFVYLALVLDEFSRKVVGWALERTLAAQLTVPALEQAIAQRQPPPSLVHHSDRGLQYASEEYAQVLRLHGIVPSMSQPINPYDNAFCESFMRTLKREEIDARSYRDLDDLRAHVQEFIEQYYNHRQLHSALGYRPLEEFEQAAALAEHNTAAHKLARIVYHMLKTREPYNESVFARAEIKYQQQAETASGQWPKNSATQLHRPKPYDARLWWSSLGAEPDSVSPAEAMVHHASNLDITENSKPLL